MKNTRVEAALCGGDTAPVPPEHPLAGQSRDVSLQEHPWLRTCPRELWGLRPREMSLPGFLQLSPIAPLGFSPGATFTQLLLPLHISDSEDGAAPWVWVLP